MIKTPLLTAEEEHRLAIEARAGSRAAFDRLVCANLRLVYVTANPMRRYGYDLEELLAEGYLGLVEAARRYDPNRRVRFASYARHWIFAYIRRYTLFNRRVVRLPTSRVGRKLLASMRPAQRHIEGRTGREATRAEVAQALDVELRDVDLFEMGMQSPKLDLSIGADHDAGETDPPAPEPERDTAAVSAQIAMIRATLGTLTPMERKVVTAKYLDTTDKVTLVAVGAALGFSRERARQLEAQALQKIRKAVGVVSAASIRA